ncbi:MAG: carbohydrate ABC transporter permease, partial [Clostridiales bacterium]|nr:carbohydrate ABC transporter permease [Clostridiales bacterium]
ALALIVTYFAAYALLRKGLRGRGLIVAFLTVPMFFGGGLFPTWLFYSKIHLRNTFFVYILPFAFNFFNMVIIRTYLLNIPDSLRESARVDGASEIRILFQIMFPLSMPIIATVLLWNAVFHWNDWTSTLYFVDIGYRELFTLQYNLEQVLKESQRIQELIKAAMASGRPLGDISDQMTPEAIVSAQIVVSTLPVILVYPFLQKYFIQGVMIGSVKE